MSISDITVCNKKSSVKISVTAIKFIKNNKLLAGIGSDFLVFSYSENSISLPYVKKKVHGEAIIHGICPNDDGSLVALFGGKLITIVALKLDDSVVKISVDKSWVVKDWIWDVHWMDDSSLLTTISAHNVLSLWEWKSAEEIETAMCEENCILYTAQLIGNTWQDTVILSGTVFREVVIWIAQGEKDAHRVVLHRLQGHNGVIFSINYDAKSKRISSTSDDRTIRIWSVNFESDGSLAAENWKNASIQLLFTIFGHTSRVWRSQILSDRRIISIGEDSMLCAWNEEGSCIWQHESHQGGGIWSVDCNENLRLIATGGADGGVSLWPLDFPAILSKALPIPPDTPRKLALLSHGKIITVTDLGYLMISSGGQWTVAQHDIRIASYCLLEVSSCMMFIALATIDGDVIISKANNNNIGPIEKIVDMQAVDGKIFSMHWLEGHHLILCGHFGNLSLWRLDYQNDLESELEKIADLSLPYSKERWLTSALLLDSILICGDRDGSIHVYNLKADSSNNKVVSQTLRRIHGRLGVSSLKWLDNRVWSTGRDGTLRQFRLSNNELHCVSVDKLSMEWAANLIESLEFGVLVLGFRGVSFVIWSVQERRTLIRLKCGGGHRSWGCSLDRETLYFIYLKDKTAHTLCCPLRDITRPLLLEGFHVREINSLVKLPVSTSRGIWLASGGEDTTVRITHFEEDDFRSGSVIRSHLSSIRVVHVVPCDASHSALMFTAGGRAQIKVWKIHIDPSANSPEVSTVELASDMLQEDKQSRPWWKVKPTNTPETRYMDIDVVKYSESCLLVLVASSDTFLRLFTFDLTTNKMELKRSLWYSHNCLLKVGSLTWKDDILVAFSAATDGKIAFWSLSDIETVNVPFSILTLHQSGINACDWRILSSDSVLLATGGDDNSLNVCCIQEIVSPDIKAEIQTKWTDSFNHCSQITGIKIMTDYIISAGVDQRINIMNWNIESGQLRICKIAQYISSIPDIHGLEVWPQVNDFVIIVYGAGIQVLRVGLDSASIEG